MKCKTSKLKSRKSRMSKKSAPSPSWLHWKLDKCNEAVRQAIVLQYGKILMYYWPFLYNSILHHYRRRFPRIRGYLLRILSGNSNERPRNVGGVDWPRISYNGHRISSARLGTIDRDFDFVDSQLLAQILASSSRLFLFSRVETLSPLLENLCNSYSELNSMQRMGHYCPKIG